MDEKESFYKNLELTLFIMFDSVHLCSDARLFPRRETRVNMAVKVPVLWSLFAMPGVGCK